MAIRSTFTTGEVLTAADLTDTIKGAFINTETTTARTLGTADAGNLVTLNNNSGGTVTIPTNTTWGSPLGTLVHLINIGTAGSFTVGTAAGVTLNAASATLAIQEGGTLIKTATNTWQFVKGGGLGKAQYSSTTGSPSVTTVSGKTCVQFTGSGSITISQAGTVDVLLVAGGGGGGNAGGGGGGGNVNYMTSVYLSATAWTVTVGGGGTGGTISGQTGTASRIGTGTTNGFLAPGGGGGGKSNDYGLNGANGGGAGANSAGAGGTGSPGFNGGSSSTVGPNFGAGGGGGNSANGSNGTSTAGGNGGDGTANSITGSSVTYGGGGGGGKVGSGGTQGLGGTGGGGNGGTSGAGSAGTANTGGGGGGGTYVAPTYFNGGAGGSGTVIILFG